MDKESYDSLVALAQAERKRLDGEMSRLDAALIALEDMRDGNVEELIAEKDTQVWASTLEGIVRDEGVTYSFDLQYNYYRDANANAGFRPDMYTLIVRDTRDGQRVSQTPRLLSEIAALVRTSAAKLRYGVHADITKSAVLRQIAERITTSSHALSDSYGITRIKTPPRKKKP